MAISPADSDLSPTPTPVPTTAAQLPELPDRALQRIEDIVARTQRSLLEGIEGVLQRQVTPLLDQTRRALLETTGQVLRDNADLLAARLKGAVLETVDELRRRETEPLLQRIKETVLGVLEETAQRYGAPLLAGVQDAVGEALRRQLEPALGRARQGVHDGVEFVRGEVELLVGKVRAAVTAPLAEALRVHVPQYARRAGGRVLDYVVAATLFCVAAVFLLVGAVGGLQQAGLPPYVTHILGGLGALGTGLVFLRLYRRSVKETMAEGPPER